MKGKKKKKGRKFTVKSQKKKKKIQKQSKICYLSRLAFCNIIMEWREKKICRKKAEFSLVLLLVGGWWEEKKKLFS
jgi:hypothetical protein